MAKNLKILHRISLVVAASLLIVFSGWSPTPSVGSAICARTVMDGYPKPSHEVKPTYPISMLKAGQNGGVSFQFVINHQGNVETPVIWNADPPGAFELTALQALRQFKYDPKSITKYQHKMISSEPLRIEGIWDFRFISRINQHPDIVVPSTKFPDTAIVKGFSEGVVVVEFQWKRTDEQSKLAEVEDYAEPDVNDTKGVYRTDSPKVVFAEPSGVFEESALHALASVRYDFFFPWIVSSPPTLPPNDDDAISKLHHFEFSLNSKPKSITFPTYPEQAIQNDIEGNVVVKFDISTEGRVLNPVVIHSDVPGVFDTVAIDSVSQFTYDSHDRVTTDVLHLVTFQLNDELELLSDSGITDSDPRLLQEMSLSDILDWYVDVQFDVNESGAVESAEVLESNAPKRQQSLALRHTSDARFKPKVVDGRPVRVSNFQHRYVFSPTEVNSSEKIAELFALNGSIQEPLYFIHSDANEQVIVEFDVDERGIVNNPKIIDSTSKEHYADLSLAMVKDFRYDPLKVDGKNVAVPKVRHSFNYGQNNKINGSYRIHLDDGKPRFGIAFRPSNVQQVIDSLNTQIFQQV